MYLIWLFSLIENKFQELGITYHPKKKKYEKSNLYANCVTCLIVLDDFLREF